MSEDWSNAACSLERNIFSLWSSSSSDHVPLRLFPFDFLQIEIQSLWRLWIQGQTATKSIYFQLWSTKDFFFWKFRDKNHFFHWILWCSIVLWTLEEPMILLSLPKDFSLTLHLSKRTDILEFRQARSLLSCSPEKNLKSLKKNHSNFIEMR